MGQKQFSWVATYKELSTWLYRQEENQSMLIRILQEIGIDRFTDINESGQKILLNEIDPFTFFSYLNKFKNQERLRKLRLLHKKLQLTCSIPNDVAGLPTINPMKVWLFPYKIERKPEDVKYLWRLFKQAVDRNIDEATFKYVLGIKSVGKAKLSICLFYTDPKYYLPLDAHTAQYLKNKKQEYTYSTYEEYLSLVNRVEENLQLTGLQISLEARGVSSRKNSVIPITSIPELLEHISELSDSEDNDKGMVFYRGHSDISYELKPYVYREKEFITHEDHMYKELIGQVPSEFSQCTSTFERLVKMQHYGLPTRLLDITTNPLVALYFACKDNSTRTGVLYRFTATKEYIKYYDSDAVSVISNISRRPVSFSVDSSLKIAPSDTEEERKDKIAKFNSTPDIVYLLHEIRGEKPHFQPLIDIEDIERVYCVLPKMDNPRIIKQNGAFFLFGIKGEKKNPSDFIFEKTEFRIAGEFKKKILQQLGIMGIDEASLFPDIDHASEHVRKKYHED